MVYTDLRTLRGLDKPTDYGSGVEYANGLTDNLFANQGVGLQIGLWLDGAAGCDEINSGLKDNQIQKLVHYLNNCNATQIFLRIGYEFDNPQFGYSSNPSSYIEAYRRIVDAIRSSSSGMDNIQFVWHSWAAPRASKDLTLNNFYPGDEYVDWIGVSIFQQVYPWSRWEAGTMNDIDEVMQFASARGKPTMIAESTPFGGIDMDTYETKTYHETDPWNRWFGKVLDIIDKYDVSMWCYINCDWDAQPMWHGVGFGETRISSNDDVMRKWQKHVITNEHGHSSNSDDGKKHSHRSFLMAGSLQDCGQSRNGSIKKNSNSENSTSVSLLATGEEDLDMTLLESNNKQLYFVEAPLHQSSTKALMAGGALLFVTFFSLVFLRRRSTMHNVPSNNTNKAYVPFYSLSYRSCANIDEEHPKTPNETNPLLNH